MPHNHRDRAPFGFVPLVNGEIVPERFIYDSSYFLDWRSHRHCERVIGQMFHALTWDRVFRLETYAEYLARCGCRHRDSWAIPPPGWWYLAAGEVIPRGGRWGTPNGRVTSSAGEDFNNNNVVPLLVPIGFPSSPSPLSVDDWLESADATLFVEQFHAPSGGAPAVFSSNRPPRGVRRAVVAPLPLP